MSAIRPQTIFLTYCHDKDLREKLVVSLQREIHRLREENLLLRRHLSASPQSVEESGGRAAKDPGTLSCPQKSGEERRAWPSSSETSLRSMLQELRRQNDKLQWVHGTHHTCVESRTQRETFQIVNTLTKRQQKVLYCKHVESRYHTRTEHKADCLCCPCLQAR